ncbi:MAG: hypothetical protein JW807_11820 [Spirochaetes bacterium]|nr:hypothetical protein [Spirochaetota bacterium]
MKGFFFSFMAFLLFSMLSGCVSAIVQDDVMRYRSPEEYNFLFIGYDLDVNNPEDDRRSYYKLFIDKSEEGRTTTGLESQQKTYEANLQPNRHLVTVEKWVLDQKSGRYVKLNNIEQPKPNFIYFDLPEDRIVIVKMTTARSGEAEFKIDYERD